MFALHIMAKRWPVSNSFQVRKGRVFAMVGIGKNIPIDKGSNDPSGNFLHVMCMFHACLKKHACHSIVSIVLYACHMQHALKTFKIPACCVHVTCTQHANMHGKCPKSLHVTC